MNSYINTSDFLEAIECADTDIIADYGPFYGTECGYSKDRIREIIASLPQQSVVHMDTKRLCENIFEITCVATRLLDSNEIAVDDSRDLFVSVVQIALDFEKQFDPENDNYLLEIEDYAERRLLSEFRPED